jgi:hypothetical protein
MDWSSYWALIAQIAIALVIFFVPVGFLVYTFTRFVTGAISDTVSRVLGRVAKEAQREDERKIL